MKVILVLPALALVLGGCALPNDADLFGRTPAPAPVATMTPGPSSGGSSSSSSSSSGSTGSGGSPVVEEPTPCSPDMSTDPLNCGSCGNACQVVSLGLWDAQLVCVGGQCVLDCKTNPYNPNGHDCDGLVETGCEALFLSDSNNCGGCGIVCGAGLHCKVTDYVNTTAKCVL